MLSFIVPYPGKLKVSFWDQIRAPRNILSVDVSTNNYNYYINEKAFKELDISEIIYYD